MDWRWEGAQWLRSMCSVARGLVYPAWCISRNMFPANGPALGKQRQAEICEFEASRIYRVSFRTVRATQRCISCGNHVLPYGALTCVCSLWLSHVCVTYIDHTHPLCSSATLSLYPHLNLSGDKLAPVAGCCLHPLFCRYCLLLQALLGVVAHLESIYTSYHTC